MTFGSQTALYSTEDDSIALNCPEGYSGNISRVSVDNCTFDSWSLMRLYTTNWNTPKFNIDSVSVSNCTGRLSEAAFLIGIAGQSNPNSVDRLRISDCQLSAPAILGLAENFGNITLKKVTFTPWQSRVNWVEPQVNRICAFARPSPLYGDVSFAGGSLSFENCSLGDFENLVAAIVLENDSTIDNLIFNGFGLAQSGAVPPMPALLEVGGGSIRQLLLNSLNGSNITVPAPANEFSNVGSVSGTGVLATGWQFPDAVMADEVPYISATTGLPSIKINGIPQPYPG